MEKKRMLREFQQINPIVHYIKVEKWLQIPQLSRVNIEIAELNPWCSTKLNTPFLGCII